MAGELFGAVREGRISREELQVRGRGAGEEEREGVEDSGEKRRNGLTQTDDRGSSEPEEGMSTWTTSIRSVP